MSRAKIPRSRGLVPWLLTVVHYHSPGGRTWVLVILILMTKVPIGSNYRADRTFWYFHNSACFFSDGCSPMLIDFCHAAARGAPQGCQAAHQQRPRAWQGHGAALWGLFPRRRRRWRCLGGSHSTRSGVACRAVWCRFWPGGGPWEDSSGPGGPHTAPTGSTGAWSSSATSAWPAAGSIGVLCGPRKREESPPLELLSYPEKGPWGCFSPPECGKMH